MLLPRECVGEMGVGGGGAGPGEWRGVEGGEGVGVGELPVEEEVEAAASSQESGGGALGALAFVLLEGEMERDFREESMPVGRGCQNWGCWERVWVEWGNTSGFAGGGVHYCCFTTGRREVMRTQTGSIHTNSRDI